MHDQLTLQINKVNISVDRDRLKYDQNERGKIVDVTVLDTDGLKAYDLTGKNIRFFDLKQGTPPKVISDDGSTSTGGKFIRTPENDKLGKFSYQFQEFTYQQSGEAHFEFYTDKDHVDVTSNFAIDIIAEGQIAPDNSSYVSSMAELIDQLKAATDHASDSIGALTTASDAAKKAATDAIQAMRDQVATYATQVTDAQASWIAQSKKINDDAANQLASLKTKDQNEIATIVKSIADQRDAAISDLNKKAHDQLGSIQSDYSNWKTKTIADFNSTVDPIKKTIEQNNDTLNQVNKSVAEVKKEFDSVDFTKFVTGDTIKNYYTKEETDLRLAQAGKVKSVNGNLPDQDGDVHVPSYAPNLLLGTQGKPKTVEMTFWTTNADHYFIDPSIDLAGQKVTASIKLAKSANDATLALAYSDSTGAWHYPWGNVVPAGTTGYSTVTHVLPANVKNIYVSPSWTTGTAKGTCTYSEAKLAVWKSASLPPDMTWLPNEADKANTSDVYTKAEVNSKTSGTVVTDYDIADKKPTMVTDSYTKKWLVDQNALGAFADQINQLKGNYLAWKSDIDSLQNNVYTKSDIDGKVNISGNLFRMIQNANTWRDIFGVNNNSNVLTSLRINPSGYNGPLLNNYAAGIGFGGADTKGVLSVEYYDHQARITGGNGDKPVWSEDIAWKSDINNLQKAIEAGYMKKPTVISKADYDKLSTKDPNTLYEITE